jgi:hypothetical protein
VALIIYRWSVHMTFSEALNKAWPNGIATDEIGSIENAVELGTSVRQCWFRGHSKCFETLLPTIFREPYYLARTNIAFWAGQRFRYRARSYTEAIPLWDEHLSWLLLMQHHGVPTNLLDWTENVLVALYFAVASHGDEPGELWCMRPSALNWHGNWKICSPDDPPIRYLAAESFMEEKALPNLRAILGLDKTPATPLAFVPPFAFPRLRAQMSRFTIHPSRDATSLIEFLLRTDDELIRYVVPAHLKAELKADLVSLGISHETLFHSLDSLAQRIKEEILEEDFVREPPPRFKKGTK